MPPASFGSMLIQLIEQVHMEQRQELKRAIGLRQSDPIKSAYHTGLADGRNGIINALRAMLNSASISKGGNTNAGQ
jgi:hypothetical protein